MRAVYIETSIVSYCHFAPKPGSSRCGLAGLTAQWWERERLKFDLFTSELVIAEAAGGDEDAAKRHLDRLREIPVLAIDDTAQQLAAQLIRNGVSSEAQADALHIAIASVHGLDYLLTWNCRHIDNAVTKPIIRSICAIVVIQSRNLHAVGTLFGGGA